MSAFVVRRSRNADRVVPAGRMSDPNGHSIVRSVPVPVPAPAAVITF
jgi:hypothetical protein